MRYLAIILLLVCCVGADIITKEQIQTTQPVFEGWREGDVALMIIASQSNGKGVGGTAIPSAPNVFVIGQGSRSWKPYDNLDNNVVRNTHAGKRNPLTAMAELWQNKIDAGESLPDLYIMNVSYTSQGMSTKELAINKCRWNPHGLKSDGVSTWDVPVEGVVNLNASLFWLLEDVIIKGVLELHMQGKRVIHLKTDWSQYENDVQTIESVNDYRLHLRLLRNMVDRALGIHDANFMQWIPRSQFPTYTYVDELRTVFEEHKGQGIYNIDVKWSPYWNDSDTINQGVFVDGKHYRPEVYDWQAQYSFDVVKNRGRVVYPAL